MEKHARLAAGSHIPEIGCGGAGARLILRRFCPASLVIADLDPVMIGKARRRLRASVRERMLATDAQCLPFGGRLFEAVFGFGVLHHLPNWRACLEEIARVLKPGGLYLLEKPYPSFYRNAITKHLLHHPAEDLFRGPELRAGLTAAGLSLMSSIGQPLLGILAVCRKSSMPPP